MAREEADRVGVNYIKVLGHKTSTEEIKSTASLNKLNSMAPLPANSTNVVGGSVVLMRVLAFVTALLRDLECVQNKRRAASLDPSLINVSGDLNSLLCFAASGFGCRSKVYMSVVSQLFFPSQESHLAVDNLSLEKIWNLYVPLTLK